MNMASTLNNTPSANRTHIVFIGKMNSGKSSLINAFSNQSVSIVSDIKGTTTDPVSKAIEIKGIGASVIIDTAGLDDESELGRQRVSKGEKALEQADVVIIVISTENASQLELEKKWYDELKNKKIPVVVVLNKSDLVSKENLLDIISDCKRTFNDEIIITSASLREGIDELRENVIKAVSMNSELTQKRYITSGLVKENDTVLLVMPQDAQAPEGRLILPQAQTIRELLDKNCIVVSVTTQKLKAALERLNEPPTLIITDSQVFKEVYEVKPKASKLTSFSTLFAAYKGDIDEYVKGARCIDELDSQSKVLIAECCTHAPMEEDIGRVKIPRMLRKKYGESLTIDVVSGKDFPDDLTKYNLIIQCGACMFNRSYVLSRINNAKEQGVPITNYGIAIAHIKGILDKVEIPT